MPSLKLFQQNYELIAELHYDPLRYFTNSVAFRILAFGAHRDFLEYRYRGTLGTTNP